MTQRLHFIGVSTSGSRIMDLFPVWASELDLDAEIVGRDVQIGAPADRYRQVVEEIADSPEARGALVTTHKVALIEHARGLFAELDPHAELLREVSCISKRNDEQLVGHAKDPITAGQTLDAMLSESYWSGHETAEVLCMGAGGAGSAITVRLLAEDTPPSAITVTDRDPDRLEALQHILDDLGESQGPRTDVTTAQVDGTEDHDRLLHRLPPGSLVINATGMGKDIPGSPLTDAARFPERSVVWELNYRGPRPFLHQAREQADDLDLDVHDGWRYFLHGWTEVIAEVFRVDLTRERFQRLARAAEPFRP